VETGDFYRALFQKHPLPAWINDLSTLGILEVNDAAVANYGYSREEFLSMTLLDIRPAEQVPAMMKSIKNARRTGAVECAAVSRHKRKDGSIIDVEVASRALDWRGRPAVLVIARDITDQKRVEEALRRERDLVRSILGSSPEGIVTTDLEGRILDCNQAALDMGNIRSKGELIGRITFDFIAERDRERAMDAAKRALATGAVKGEEFTLLTADGKEYPGEISSALVRDPEGRPWCYVGVVKDITERKRAEKDQRKMRERLEQARKMEVLGKMTGGMAHDFNNLLTTILGNAEMIASETPPGTATREMLDDVITASRKAAELTNRMLAYSGTARLHLQPVNLSSLVWEVDGLLRGSISGNCALEYRLDASLPFVSADASYLRQVVVNLVVNGSEALGEGAGVVAVSTGVVDLEPEEAEEYRIGQALPGGRYVFIEVTDTGTGMTPEVRERIFDPFFSTKFTGRGLGLAAVQGIVRGHKGGIKVNTEPGRGASFRIILPAPARG
jgi:PAS domain S-box-containing protein